MRADRAQSAAVLEQNDAVAEQAPTLFRVADHGARGKAVGRISRGTLWQVRTHVTLLMKGVCRLVAYCSQAMMASTLLTRGVEAIVAISSRRCRDCRAATPSGRGS
jgi:hypothetical protein